MTDRPNDIPQDVWDAASAVVGPPDGLGYAKVFTEGLEDVIAERERQKVKEGWTPEHDDAYTAFELARAAAAYALWATGVPLNGQRHVGSFRTEPYSIWPWSGEWWKPTNRRRNLVKAAALILAEIGRLDRLAIRNAKVTHDGK